MHQIDVEELIMRRLVAIVPEPGGGGLVDAGAGNHDIWRSAEFVRKDIKEALELVPGGNVGSLEKNLQTSVTLGRLQPLRRLAVQRYVPDEDGTAVCMYGLCEGEVDTCMKVLNRVGKLRDKKQIGECFALPEPPPVMMAPL